MGSTNRVGGGPDERLWTRIAFDGLRPPGGMFAAFSHIAKQRGRHSRSSRLTEIGPHLLKLTVGDGSAEHTQKRFAIESFGDVILSGVSTEFSEAALKISGSMQIRKHSAIEPSHRFDAIGLAGQQFLRYRDAVVMGDQGRAVDTQVAPQGPHEVGLLDERVAIRIGFVAAAVAQKIQGRHAIAGARQVRHDACPVERRRGKAVEQGYRLAADGAILAHKQRVRRAADGAPGAPPEIQESSVVFTGEKRALAATGRGLGRYPGSDRIAVGPETIRPPESR